MILHCLVCVFFFRLAAYADEWPHLECWFSNYGCLFCVDASLPEHDIASQVMEYIAEVIKRVSKLIRELLFQRMPFTGIFRIVSQ